MQRRATKELRPRANGVGVWFLTLAIIPFVAVSSSFAGLIQDSIARCSWNGHTHRETESELKCWAWNSNWHQRMTSALTNGCHCMHPIQQRGRRAVCARPKNREINFYNNNNLYAFILRTPTSSELNVSDIVIILRSMNKTSIFWNYSVTNCRMWMGNANELIEIRSSARLDTRLFASDDVSELHNPTILRALSTVADCMLFRPDQTCHEFVWANNENETNYRVHDEWALGLHSLRRLDVSKCMDMHAIHWNSLATVKQFIRSYANPFCNEYFNLWYDSMSW